MKNLLIFILLVNIVYPSVGQQSCEYSEYFTNVSEASYDAYLKNFESSQKKYKKAFSEISFPLGQDLSKALNVAKQLNDTIWSEELSIKLAKGGIPLSYFKKFDNYSWYHKFETEFDSYQEYHKTNFNLNLKQQLIDLRTQDSIFNENWHKWKRGEIKMSLSEHIDGAKKIYEEFKTIYEKNGFPSEHKMGYFFNESKIDEYPTYVLLIHINQRGIIFLREKMVEVVCDGKMRPELRDGLQGMKGFGEENIGIEEEMKIRYEMFKKN